MRIKKLSLSAIGTSYYIPWENGLGRTHLSKIQAGKASQVNSWLGGYRPVDPMLKFPISSPLLIFGD
jgi:hypothetical protein